MCLRTLIAILQVMLVLQNLRDMKRVLSKRAKPSLVPSLATQFLSLGFIITRLWGFFPEAICVCASMYLSSLVLLSFFSPLNCIIEPLYIRTYEVVATIKVISY